MVGPAWFRRARSRAESAQWIGVPADRRVAQVEVKIGVQNAPREIVFDSDEQPADVEASVSAALRDGSVLALSDGKGGRILVPSDKIGYVEIGPGTERRVGFGAIS